MKDRQIEELKKNIKMSKHRENENEVQAYADECIRLRSQLEQALLQNHALAQMQSNETNQDDNGMQED